MTGIPHLHVVVSCQLRWFEPNDGDGAAEIALPRETLVDRAAVVPASSPAKSQLGGAALLPGALAGWEPSGCVLRMRPIDTSDTALAATRPAGRRNHFRDAGLPGTQYRST